MIPLIALLACGAGEVAAPGDDDLPTDDGTGGDEGSGDTDDTLDSGGGGTTPAAGVDLSPVYAGGGASGADLAVAPDGALYATWVRSGHAWLAVSEDGGATWSDAVYLNSSGSAQVYDVSHPNVVVDSTRVVVAMAAGGEQRLYLADRSDLDFGEPVVLGADRDDLMYEGIFLTAHLAPDGEAWAGVHAFPHGGGWHGGWKGLARETDSWALEPASTGAPGEPCECCPHDVAWTSGGALVLAYRNNEDDLRDIYTASADDGALPDTWTHAGTNGWEIGYCPVQGPRLAESSDGALHMAWADASTGSYEIYQATSTDDGRTWTDSLPVLAEDGDPHRTTPTLAADATGRMLLAWTDGLEGDVLAWSGDDGATWTSLGELEAPGGVLTYIEVAGGGDFIGGIAADAAGDVWLITPVE